MTGRFQRGDRVRTEHGDGTIVHSYAVIHNSGLSGWHIVELDQETRGVTRQMYRTDQLEFLGRQLALDDSD